MTTHRTAGVPGCNTDACWNKSTLMVDISNYVQSRISAKSWLHDSIISSYLTQHSTSCMGSLEGTKIGSPSRLDFGSDDKKVHCMGVLK